MKTIKYLSIVVIVAMAFSASAQIPKPSTGTIKHFENFRSKYVAARNVDVWLPDGYDTNKQYDVLYMHDGKALFDAAITWNHQEWGVDETIGELMKQKRIENCIVVGIWNVDGLRHSEYFPQKPFESLSKEQQDELYKMDTRSLGADKPQMLFGAKVQSDNYLKFIVQELKPFIDSSFSTLPDAAHTFIAGSSMGGLISWYAVCEYPNVFGGAACISTHWPGVIPGGDNPVPAAFMKYLRKNLPSASNHKFYFDHGTAALDSLYEPYQEQVDQLMKEEGYTSKSWTTEVFTGAEHSEAYWSRRFSVPVQFLMRRKKESE